MKRWKLLLAGLLISSIPTAGFALDPLAPRAQRAQGMIYVFTPQPGDTVTVSGSGYNQTLQPGKIYWVPVGNYTVTAKMQEYTYNQSVLVQPTERTDVIVPGYGMLKVNSINPSDVVEVLGGNKGGVIAKFPASQIKVLPQGRYNVKVNVGKASVTKDNVWVVSNTTRQVDVTYADARATH